MQIYGKTLRKNIQFPNFYYICTVFLTIIAQNDEISIYDIQY